MRSNKTLKLIAAAAFAATLMACDTAGDDQADPDTASPTPAVSVSASPVTVPSASPVDEPDVDASGKADDPGIEACQKIIDNTKANKLPLPVNETPAYYLNFKANFTKSEYADVKDAGEKFVNQYVEAIKAGGANVDANKLADAAETLIGACEKHK